MRALKNKSDNGFNGSDKRSDFIVEAIIEDLDAKRKLFSEIDQLAPKHSILVSNTSSLSITALERLQAGQKM